MGRKHVGKRNCVLFHGAHEIVILADFPSKAERNPAHRLNVHAVLQGQGRERVMEVVEPDLGQPCPFQHPVQHAEHAVQGDGPTVGRWEDIVVRDLFLLSF